MKSSNEVSEFNSAMMPFFLSEEAKRALPPKPEGSSGDGEEREDELPTVVVLRQGDVSEKEFLESRQKMKEEGISAFSESPTSSVDVPTVRPRPSSEGDTASPTDDPGEGRIQFKKPSKRSGGAEERGGVLDASSSTTTSSKKSRTMEESPQESAATVVVGGVTRRRRRSSGGESKSRKVKNSCLLSFGGDEEEDH